MRDGDAEQSPEAVGLTAKVGGGKGSYGAVGRRAPRLPNCWPSRARIWGAEGPTSAPLLAARALASASHAHTFFPRLSEPRPRSCGSIACTRIRRPGIRAVDGLPRSDGPARCSPGAAMRRCRRLATRRRYQCAALAEKTRTCQWTSQLRTSIEGTAVHLTRHPRAAAAHGRLSAALAWPAFFSDQTADYVCIFRAVSSPL